MPNLALIANNPEELKKSIECMSGNLYSRDKISFNHGIHTPQELEEMVCQKLFIPSNLDAIGRLLEKMNAE
jgi:hypothetical protein